jgi:peptidoglycan-associated lipoprotein
MKAEGKIVIAALGVAMMAVAGCANKEVVKTEEPISPAVQSSKAETVKPAVAPQEPTAEAKTGASQNATSAAIAEKLETIYFDFDKADLSQAARAALTKDAGVMKARPGIKVKIEGNCDERGSAEYNLALGERRATSALQYLITLGIAADRLSTISYGKEHPAVQGHDEAAWAKNRRDDFVVQ